jgi:hypothetical protein
MGHLVAVHVKEVTEVLTNQEDWFQFKNGAKLKIHFQICDLGGVHNSLAIHIHGSSHGFQITSPNYL